MYKEDDKNPNLALYWPYIPRAAGYAQQKVINIYSQTVNIREKYGKRQCYTLQDFVHATKSE